MNWKQKTGLTKQELKKSRIFVTAFGLSQMKACDDAIDDVMTKNRVEITPNSLEHYDNNFSVGGWVVEKAPHWAFSWWLRIPFNAWEEKALLIKAWVMYAQRKFFANVVPKGTE